MNHIYNSDTISHFLSENKSKRIIFTNGCFDLLHPGHVQYLADAKSLGDILIVGLNSDTSVTQLKGPNRPINDQVFRSQMLLALKPVDAVIIFEEDTPISVLSIIKPNIHVKGGDYQPEQLPEYETVVSNGGEVKCVSFIEGYSSSEIIAKILAN
ncbi:MAG: D-glycero-beta-D-manno-heptose 1-phosphate adenylyltransferase [Candidatus Marinamargulisbacteria bacterium]